jgi:hypothetical protein
MHVQRARAQATRASLAALFFLQVLPPRAGCRRAALAGDPWNDPTTNDILIPDILLYLTTTPNDQTPYM